MNNMEQAYLDSKRKGHSELPYDMFRAGWYNAISDMVDHLDKDTDLSIIDRDTINVFLLKYAKSLQNDPC